MIYIVQVQITPRITAQIVARHAKLGDKIKAGQPLVTLTSVEMAEAQGALIIATREWNRVRELGRKVVSEKRFIEAQVSAEKARASVLAYGMVPEQVDALVKAGDASKATGTFELLAPQAGNRRQRRFCYRGSCGAWTQVIPDHRRKPSLG